MKFKNYDFKKKLEDLPISIADGISHERRDHRKFLVAYSISTQHKEFIKAALDNLPVFIQSEPQDALDLIHILLQEDFDEHPEILNVVADCLTDLFQKDIKSGITVVDNLLEIDLNERKNVLSSICSAFPVIVENSEEKAVACCIGTSLLEEDTSEHPFIIKTILDSLPELIKNNSAEVRGDIIAPLLDADLEKNPEILPVILENVELLLERNFYQGMSLIDDLLEGDLDKKSDIISKVCDVFPTIVEGDVYKVPDLSEALLKEDLKQYPIIVETILNSFSEILEQNSWRAEEVFESFVEKDLIENPQVGNKILEVIPTWIEKDLETGVDVLEQIVTKKGAQSDLVLINKALDDAFLDFSGVGCDTDEFGEKLFKISSKDSTAKKFERGMLCSSFAVSVQSPGSKRHTFIVTDPHRTVDAYVYAGCFSGNVEEFEESVAETHPDKRTKDRKHYDGVIKLAKAYDARLRKPAVK